VSSAIDVVIKLSQIILCERSSLSLPNACLAASADKPNHVATASIKKPIHNVKEAHIVRHITDLGRQTATLHLWKSWLEPSDWRSNEPKVREAERPSPLMRRT